MSSHLCKRLEPYPFCTYHYYGIVTARRISRFTENGLSRSQEVENSLVGSTTLVLPNKIISNGISELRKIRKKECIYLIFGKYERKEYSLCSVLWKIRKDRR